MENKLKKRILRIRNKVLENKFIAAQEIEILLYLAQKLQIQTLGSLHTTLLAQILKGLNFRISKKALQIAKNIFANFPQKPEFVQRVNTYYCYARKKIVIQILDRQAQISDCIKQIDIILNNPMQTNIIT